MGILQIIRSSTGFHLVFYSVFSVVLTILDRYLLVEQHKNPYYLCFVASFLTDHGGVVSRATVEKELKNISTIWISRERREALDSLALVLCSHFGKPVKTSFLIRYLIDNFADKAVAELVAQHQPRRDK